MANKKITELTAYSTPAAADVLPIVDVTTGLTKKTTWANLFKDPTITASTYAVTLPTNGMAAAKFMLGDSNTIAWFYLNAAPPGWKVTATGADTVLAVSGGAGLYNVNGGTAGGESWANLKGHTHTGPSHTHPLGSMAGPAHTHTLTSAATGANYDAATTSIVAIIGGNLMAPGAASASVARAKAVTGNPSATALTGEMTADGTGATGAQSTADVRPTASIGKLFQLDTA